MAAPEYNLPPEPNRTRDNRGDERLPPRPSGFDVDVESLRPELRPAAALLCARVCDIEMTAHRNPIISTTILRKLLRQIDSQERPRVERDFNELTLGIERAAGLGLRLSIFLQAAWDEQRFKGRSELESVLERATFLDRVAEATRDDQRALAAACEQWGQLSTFLWNEHAQRLAISLFAVRPALDQQMPYMYVSDRVCALCCEANRPIDLAPVELLIRHYHDLPDVIDPVVNTYITLLRGSASLPSQMQQNLFCQLGEVVAELRNRSTPDSRALPYILLLVLSDAIQEPGRAAHIEELLGMYCTALRQGFSISPRNFVSALSLLGHTGVHQDPAKSFKTRLESGNFRTSAALLEAALESGAHQNAEFVIRTGFAPSRYVTHLRECLTSRAMTDVTFRGHHAGLASLYYERSLQVLDEDEISRLRALSRDLNYHHGFGALAVESSTPPGERQSLLHRFAVDHADAQLVNLAPPGYVPEYALVISNLEPERVFAAHGPEHDPFKPYKDAWPDYTDILPNLAKQVFVVSRRFLATYTVDSGLPATIWWNDHFPSPTATVSHMATSETLKALLAAAPHVGIVAAVKKFEEDGTLVMHRLCSLFDPTSQVELGHRLVQTRALDLFKIAYSQWKKGQTLPKQFPLDPHARPSESSSHTEQDGFASENHAHTSHDSARMLHEAWRWHSLRAAGVSNRERFPILIVANTLDSWSEIDSPIELDTYDMTLTVQHRALGRLDSKGSRRAIRLWTEQVLPAATDQSDALKELRFIFHKRER